MADERDPKVSQRYRELGAEEPPRALDEAILAASRRAVESRPAPLVAPTGRRRWYFPVAAAAVITLAVAVTVHVDRERPDDERVASAPSTRALKEEMQALRVPATPAPAQEAIRAPQEKGFTPDPPRASAPRDNTEAPGELAKQQAETRARSDSARDSVASAPAAPPVAAQGAPAPAPEPARREMEAQRPQASTAAGARMMAKVESPDAWLERIAELRKQGKHEEADKALAEFRQRYPDYRMTDEVKAKVERK